MFHNVLMTTLTPLSNVNEIDCWENSPFTNVWPCEQQQQRLNAPPITRTINKKKRNRTMFSSQQLKILEKTYTSFKYIDKEQRQELANALGIADKCIKVWFQNRRMREKRESSDSSNSSSENYSDSMSPTSQTDSDDTKKHVNMHTNFNTDNTIPYYQQTNNFTQNHYPTSDLQINGTYLNDTSSVQSAFYNDTNIYPTQYYPYEHNVVNYDEDHNQYYGYNSEPQTWTADILDLSYI